MSADEGRARVERSPDKDAVMLLIAANHALRSIQYGNSATELAESIADKIDAHLNATGGRSIHATAESASNGRVPGEECGIRRFCDVGRYVQVERRCPTCPHTIRESPAPVVSIPEEGK